VRESHKRARELSTGCGKLACKWVKASPDADGTSSFEGKTGESYPHFCG